MTAYLTEYFTSYLFGYHELLRMRSSRTGIYASSARRACKMGAAGAESYSGDHVPNLGKNIFPLKIYVPEMIKEGLKALALRADRKLGEFTRALICAHLFGREYGPSKLMVGTELNGEAADKWEAECLT